ncbi:hypothetical protein ADEAN_000624100 [Angomonas deanei]|uniref:Uncharacterized protein n=1 Tax=Angomonas deanei TaxID=59799 RepID=A0A7G2CFY6_9TRYP|nr:hypothetical protein ADEAN_000624100 [Angomonas deanei]
MRTSAPYVPTAGLSKAYAVLRYLDTLREEEIKARLRHSPDHRYTNRNREPSSSPKVKNAFTNTEDIQESTDHLSPTAEKDYDSDIRLDPSVQTPLKEDPPPVEHHNNNNRDTEADFPSPLPASPWRQREDGRDVTLLDDRSPTHISIAPSMAMLSPPPAGELVDRPFEPREVEEEEDKHRTREDNFFRSNRRGSDTTNETNDNNSSMFPIFAKVLDQIVKDRLTEKKAEPTNPNPHNRVNQYFENSFFNGGDDRNRSARSARPNANNGVHHNDIFFDDDELKMALRRRADFNATRTAEKEPAERIEKKQEEEPYRPAPSEVSRPSNHYVNHSPSPASHQSSSPPHNLSKEEEPTRYNRRLYEEDSPGNHGRQSASPPLISPSPPREEMRVRERTEPVVPVKEEVQPRKTVSNVFTRMRPAPNNKAKEKESPSPAEQWIASSSSNDDPPRRGNYTMTSVSPIQESSLGRLPSKSSPGLVTSEEGGGYLSLKPSPEAAYRIPDDVPLPREEGKRVWDAPRSDHTRPADHDNTPPRSPSPVEITSPSKRWQTKPNTTHEKDDAAEGSGVEVSDLSTTSLEGEDTGNTRKEEGDKVAVTPSKKTNQSSRHTVSSLNPSASPTRVSFSNALMSETHESSAPTADSTSILGETYVPLSRFLQAITRSSAANLRRELTAMGDSCEANTTECFTDDGLALTLLMNSPRVIEKVVLPLLTNELVNSPSPSRLQEVLCAIIGLGKQAAELQNTLLALMQTQANEVGGRLPLLQLSALAVRTCGGEDGMKALLQLQPDTPALHCAVLYGLSALPYDVIGHTAVVCAGPLQEQVSFYSPDPQLGYCEVLEGASRLTAGAWGEVGRPQEVPPYRPVNVLLDSQEARRLLLLYMQSSQQPRPTSLDQLHLHSLLRDVIARGTYTAVREQIPDSHKPTWQRAQARLTREVLHHLRDDAPSHRTLDNTYPSRFRRNKTLLFAVEQRLVKTVLDHSSPAVQEQALVSLATLPPYAREHSSNAVFDFFKGRLAQFDQRQLSEQRLLIQEVGAKATNTTEEEEAVLVAATVAVGVMITPQSGDSTLQEEGRSLLLRLLSSPRPALRRAACVGLGHLGVRLTERDRNEVVNGLARRLADTALSATTVTWALVRQGPQGIRKILQLLRVTDLPLDAHIACARGIAELDLMYLCFPLTREAKEALLQEVIHSVGRLIVSPGALAEEVLLECVYSLSIAVQEREVEENEYGEMAQKKKHQEAISYYKTEKANLCYEVFTSLMESSVLPFAVLKAIFYCLCKYGKGHGEVHTCHEAMESGRIMTRAAATFGLRACGARVVRTLVMSLNDEAVEVREEAVDTLECTPVEEFVEVLRHRPPQHTRQVCDALRDGLLRDIGRGVRLNKVQQLHDVLARISL